MHYIYFGDGAPWCKCDKCILLSLSVRTAARRMIQGIRESDKRMQEYSHQPSRWDGATVALQR